MSDKKKMQKLVIGSATYTTQLTNKFMNRPHWERPNDCKLNAVIPGTIQNIMVSEGQEVEVGTPMLILEAMKMRNVLRSAKNGKISKIYVRTGEMVSKDQLLVEFA